jgi:hypothetical protein
VSSETESKLSELFALVSQPSDEVTEQALARVLAALPTPARRSEQSARAFAFLLAAAVGLLAVAAGALAAVGDLHLSFGQTSTQSQRGQASSQAQLAVPGGAQGIAVTVNGRLWLTTSGGLRLQGLPVSAAALSPHALYVAVGVGNSLVAMAPNGRRAWSHPASGKVVSIAWAPDALRIAYVVDVGGSFRLYAIEGNGRNNELIDGAVRSTLPAWRADSLAIAYVAAGGHPAVYDYRHNRHTVIHSQAARNATFLAFESRGGTLAVGTAQRVVLWSRAGRAVSTTFGDAAIAGLGWIGGDLAIALNRTNPPRAQASLLRVYRIGRSGFLTRIGQVATSARIESLDSSGSQLTVAVATRTNVRVLFAPTLAAATIASLPRSQPVLELPLGSRISSVATR